MDEWRDVGTQSEEVLTSMGYVTHRAACINDVCVVVCCSVLQCVAVYCSVLQCVAVCCSVLQCVAMCCISVLHQCVASLRATCINDYCDT